jgi:hypothetical protein
MARAEARGGSAGERSITVSWPARTLVHVGSLVIVILVAVNFVRTGRFDGAGGELLAAAVLALVLECSVTGKRVRLESGRLVYRSLGFPLFRERSIPRGSITRARFRWGDKKKHEDIFYRYLQLEVSESGVAEIRIPVNLFRYSDVRALKDWLGMA